MIHVCCVNIYSVKKKNLKEVKSIGSKASGTPLRFESVSILFQEIIIFWLENFWKFWDKYFSRRAYSKPEDKNFNFPKGNLENIYAFQTIRFNIRKENFQRDW